MRATLLHNSKAGGDAAASREDLLEWLERAGVEAAYVDSKKDDLDEALEDPGALVVAAGGDGTIAKAARRLAGRGIPLAILPFGTANNIARSLGIEGDAERLVAALGAVPFGKLPRRRLDVGVARARWGERRFVEGAGAGLIAALLAADEREERATKEHTDDPSHRIALGLELLHRVAGEMPARRWRVTADGRTLTGEFVMVEAVNVRSLGPRVRLAPDADPGDGKLDLVLVRESQRAALLAYLDRVATGETLDPPVRVRRVHSVRIAGDWSSFEDFHLDDKRWPKELPEPEAGERRIPAVELALQLAVDVVVPA
ncbi:MAG TPA: diacylglycerol kinase family protein [Gemmatimonadaceae bacterium]